MGCFFGGGNAVAAEGSKSNVYDREVIDQQVPLLVDPHVTAHNPCAPPPSLNVDHELVLVNPDGTEGCEADPIQAQLQVIKVQHDLAKVVKADDATVPVHWWNDRVRCRPASPSDAQALDVIRAFVLCYYR